MKALDETNGLQSLRLLVVDDHAIVRQGLVRILSAEDPSWQVIEAPTAQRGLERLAAREADIAIVDMSMPGMSGLEMVRAAREGGDLTPLLMLTMHAEPAYALSAFKAGANGYITKDRAAEDLVKAVRAVAAGGAFVPANLASQVRVQPDGQVGLVRHANLSERELNVLRHIGHGAQTGEIATRLQLAEKAVTSTERRILEKLRLTTTQDLIDYALAHGLVV